MRKYLLLIFMTFFCLGTSVMAADYDYPTSEKNSLINEYSNHLIFSMPNGMITCFTVTPVEGGNDWSGFILEDGILKFTVNKPYSFLSFTLQTSGKWGTQSTGSYDTNQSYSNNLSTATFLQTNASLTDSETGEIILGSGSSSPDVPEDPEIPDIDTYSYIIEYVSSTGATQRYVFTSADPITFSSVVKNNQIALTFTYTSDVRLTNYIFRNEVWEQLGSSGHSGSGTQTVYLPFVEILDSDITLYNEDGTIFFQVPLGEEAVHLAGAKIMKEMWIIAIIAVCCLALLILLTIFSKVFSIFRT